MQRIETRAEADREEALLALRRIADGIQRAGEIMRRMKGFAQKARLRKSTVALAEVVEEIRPLIAHDLRYAGVAFDVEIAPGLPMVQADRIHMQQVLVNLTRNALDAMADTEPDKRRLSITAKAGDGVLEVAVSDTGQGLAPEDANKVFDAFYTTKPSGTGLGLSICRTIIEAHGGCITAKSDPDCGTTFTFTLPLSGERAEQ